jgi:hypothetical protein
VQLDARDLATLDAIAIQLYYEHPHDPEHGQLARRLSRPPASDPRAVRAMA